MRSEITELRVGQNETRAEWSTELRAVRSELKEDLRDLGRGMSGLDDRLRRVEISVASIQAHLAKTGERNTDPATP